MHRGMDMFTLSTFQRRTHVHTTKTHSNRHTECTFILVQSPPIILAFPSSMSVMLALRWGVGTSRAWFTEGLCTEGRHTTSLRAWINDDAGLRRGHNEGCDCHAGKITSKSPFGLNENVDTGVSDRVDRSTVQRDELAVALGFAKAGADCACYFWVFDWAHFKGRH